MGIPGGRGDGFNIFGRGRVNGNCSSRALDVVGLVAERRV